MLGVPLSKAKEGMGIVAYHICMKAADLITHCIVDEAYNRHLKVYLNVKLKRNFLSTSMQGQSD
jgi:hypothetical protein